MVVGEYDDVNGSKAGIWDGRTEDVFGKTHK
jgi:hypothetical protein